MIAARRPPPYNGMVMTPSGPGAGPPNGMVTPPHLWNLWRSRSLENH